MPSAATAAVGPLRARPTETPAPTAPARDTWLISGDAITPKASSRPYLEDVLQREGGVRLPVSDAHVFCQLLHHIQHDIASLPCRAPISNLHTMHQYQVPFLTNLQVRVIQPAVLLAHRPPALRLPLFGAPRCLALEPAAHSLIRV